MFNVNPLQLIQLIKGGQNPQQLLMGILNNQGRNNPILQNAGQLAQRGDISALEQVARNLAAQKGVDYDQGMNYLRNTFR